MGSTLSTAINYLIVSEAQTIYMQRGEDVETTIWSSEPTLGMKMIRSRQYPLNREDDSFRFYNPPYLTKYLSQIISNSLPTPGQIGSG